MAKQMTTNQMVRLFAQVIDGDGTAKRRDNRARYSKFNWPAHCEGKAAASRGECHHNNPYDPDYQAKDFKRWNDGHAHVVEMLTPNITMAVG